MTMPGATTALPHRVDDQSAAMRALRDAWVRNPMLFTAAEQLVATAAALARTADRHPTIPQIAKTSQPSLVSIIICSIDDEKHARTVDLYGTALRGPSARNHGHTRCPVARRGVQPGPRAQFGRFDRAVARRCRHTGARFCRAAAASSATLRRNRRHGRGADGRTGVGLERPPESAWVDHASRARREGMVRRHRRPPMRRR